MLHNQQWLEPTMLLTYGKKLELTVWDEQIEKMIRRYFDNKFNAFRALINARTAYKQKNGGVLSEIDFHEVTSGKKKLSDFYKAKADIVMLYIRMLQEFPFKEVDAATSEITFGTTIIPDYIRLGEDYLKTEIRYLIRWNRGKSGTVSIIQESLSFNERSRKLSTMKEEIIPYMAAAYAELHQEAK